MTNSIQVATINSIGDFILFLGKLTVGFVCGLISILLLRNNEDIHFYMIPCILIALFAFFIAHIILSLFEVIFTISFKSKSIVRTYAIEYLLYFVDGGRYSVFVCM